MVYNKVIPDKCKGCSHFMKNIKECLFTHHGVPYLKECLCYECLVKSICTEVCEPAEKLLTKIDYELHELSKEFNDQLSKRI